MARPISNGPRDGGALALSFDDGPGERTDELLDVLASAGARATLFCPGERLAAGRASLERAIERGHELGNHSWSHSYLTGEPELARAELARTSTAIARIAGTPPTLFRAPFGRADEALIAEAARQGMSTIGWDVDSRDWEDHDPDSIADRVLATAEPGSIVLLHDMDDAPAMLPALRLIVEVLVEEGLALVPVSELLEAT